ncbi:hypothetical protein K469DRAFT_771922 [Zopfia rhizophila CBS 207.26]|uniref:F-box domain-containing protein n=1 Tax=Zopfia rhizophila CBS 207.26 TaxID=1314779 RepID=A0A6A6E8F0_9PEZI|nr:hypothetical protein K469DRAFT_771922 [Zopfia rhizophila CBS 207.26]
MPANWINHPISTTPRIKTNDDVSNVDEARVVEFFDLVYAEFLYGINKSGGSLPQDIQDCVSECAPTTVASILEKVITEGSVMDSGWLEDYWCIVERISNTLNGYPKECLAQWRCIHAAVAGRTTNRHEESESRPKGKDSGDENFFPFLELPRHIRDKIYCLVIPHGRITISDWAVDCLPASVYRRTEYDVPSSDGDHRRTTYMVQASKHRLGTELNLMLVNKQVNRETSRLLYESSFEFRGTAASTLVFLHDHMKKLAMFKKMSIKFTAKSKVPFLGCTSVMARPPPTVKTNIDVWKKIVDIFVHSASGLEDFELIIDKSFWERAPWKEGVMTVMRDRTLCQGNVPRKLKENKNFVWEVAKLSGVNFRLVIEGEEEDKERKGFRRELEKEICERMRKRPYLAVEKKSCICRKRLLIEACAWGDEVKRRRM